MDKPMFLTLMRVCEIIKCFVDGDGVRLGALPASHSHPLAHMDWEVSAGNEIVSTSVVRRHVAICKCWGMAHMWVGHDGKRINARRRGDKCLLGR